MRNQMHTKQYNDEAGFSFIEVVIATTLMLVIVGASLSLFSKSLDISNVTFEKTEAEQNQRVAQQYISNDLINAGAGLPKESKVRIRVPRSFVEKNLTRVVTESGTYVHIGLLVSDSNVPAHTVMIQNNPEIYVHGGTDRLTMIAPGSNANSPNSTIQDNGKTIKVTNVSKFKVGDICYIDSGDRQAIGTVTGIDNVAGNLIFDNGDVYGLNSPVVNGPIYYVAYGETSSDQPLPSPLPAEVSTIRLIQYFVDEDKYLRKRIFGASPDGVDNSTIIAEHVSDLDFTYDLIASGSNDLKNQETVTTADEQNSVFQVEILVETESSHNIVKATDGTGKTKKLVLEAIPKRTLVRNFIYNKVQDPAGVN